MVDLDHFKAVNDKLGHAEGDRVLRAFGQTITATLRAKDHAGRYGGEEFVVILDGNSGCSPEPGLFLMRLRRRWAAARPHPVTFSAGIAHPQPEPQRTMKAADRALYQAQTS